MSYVRSFFIQTAAECCGNAIKKLSDVRFLVLVYRLHLNDKHYFVEPPKREKISSEETSKLGDVRSLVAQVRHAKFVVI